VPAFDHVFLTRYSAVLSPDQPPPSEDYLRYRLGFFTEATMASMASQTVKDFRWLVFVDDRCSDEFRRELDELSEDLFEPVWSHRVFWTGYFREEVARRCSSLHLITTRLDNDDAVARDFVASVHAEFESQDRLFVNFARGLQIDRSGAVHRYDYPSNPFVSLIEKRADLPPHTVFGSPAHMQVRSDGPLREVITTPKWVQVVHDGNIANSVRGQRVDPRVVDRHFDIELGFRRDVPTRTLLLERARLGLVVWRKRLMSRALLREWLVAKRDRWRGTHTKPRALPPDAFKATFGTRR
jgi:hypothetical protein